MADGALSDLTVIDLSTTVAGAYCAKLLADFGASVIKVEPPAGDPLRRRGPFPQDEIDAERSGLFLHLNTGKRGVTLDLGEPGGRQIFRELAARSDLIVESYPPGTLAGWGLDHETLLRLRPGLVMTSVTPFGQTGPYAGYGADNHVLMGMGGVAYVSGESEREPLVTGGDEAAEYLGGALALVATMAALADVEGGGGGHHVDLSVMEAVATNQEYATIMYSYMGAVRRRWRSHHSFSYPHGQVYPTADGHVTFVVGAGGLPDTMTLIGRSELAEDPLIVGPFEERLERADEFDQLVVAAFRDQAAADTVDLAQALRIPFAPVMTAQDLYESAHLRERGFFVEVDHPVAGRLPLPGPPFRMTETPAETRAAPTLGQHNTEILCGQLGFAQEDLVALREQGVI